MGLVSYPVIDPAATGRNIMRLRLEQGLTVRDVQMFFGFEEPQAIYKWQRGKSLPTIDNLYALSALLGVRMDEILVAAKPKLKTVGAEPQVEACGSNIFIAHFVGSVIELLVEWKKSAYRWSLPMKKYEKPVDKMVEWWYIKCILIHSMQENTNKYEILLREEWER